MYVIFMIHVHHCTKGNGMLGMHMYWLYCPCTLTKFYCYTCTYVHVHTKILA